VSVAVRAAELDDAWNGCRHGVPPESERWAGERCLYILRLTAGSQSEDRGGAIPGGHMAKNAVLREAPRESLRTRP